MSESVRKRAISTLGSLVPVLPDQLFHQLIEFIIHQLEKIPSTGDLLNWKIFQLEIVDMDHHRIDKVLVTLKG